mmetsp:Transcript_89697/g.239695  ORF Transcript_89697/g.239695 Transcript_89697/m.239695 type:complete len:176 (+) Transcript_89697:122-649(+)
MKNPIQESNIKTLGNQNEIFEKPVQLDQAYVRRLWRRHTRSQRRAALRKANTLSSTAVKVPELSTAEMSPTTNIIGSCQLSSSVSCKTDQISTPTSSDAPGASSQWLTDGCTSGRDQFGLPAGYNCKDFEVKGSESFDEFISLLDQNDDAAMSEWGWDGCASSFPGAPWDDEVRL